MNINKSMAAIQNQPKQGNQIKKGIHKLEELGKKGKLHKLVTITVEHFEFLKNSLNEYSLKILAYIIKGCFISINKYYQAFIKEISEFIDINIRGIVKQKRKKKQQSQKQMAETEKFTLQNLSLFSENTFFEKFLENSNMTDHIQRTLKQINKSLSQINFESLKPEEKKEYLQKNFIKPLTDNIPMTSDYFLMRKYEQTQTENGKQFADYINFNIDALTDNVIQSLQNSAKQTQSQLKLSQGYNNSNITEAPLLLSQVVQLYDASNKNKNKQNNQGLRNDPLIEISLEDYLKSIETKLSENDSEEAYVKNLKEIIMTKSLNKFIEINKEKELSYLNYQKDDYTSQEQFRHDNVLSSLKNTPELIQSTNLSLEQPELKSPEVKCDINKSRDICFSSKQSSQYRIMNKNNGLMKEKSNIKSEVSSILSSMKTNEEISLQGIANKLIVSIPTINDKSKSEQISCLFYHLLIVCQNEHKTIQQSDCFGSILYIH